jgi:hypothetical protein
MIMNIHYYQIPGTVATKFKFIVSAIIIIIKKKKRMKIN